MSAMARTYGALSGEEGTEALPISESPTTPATRGSKARLFAALILGTAGLSAVGLHSRHAGVAMTTLASPPSTVPEEASPSSKNYLPGRDRRTHLHESFTL